MKQETFWDGGTRVWGPVWRKGRTAETWRRCKFLSSRKSWDREAAVPVGNGDRRDDGHTAKGVNSGALESLGHSPAAKRLMVVPSPVGDRGSRGSRGSADLLRRGHRASRAQPVTSAPLCAPSTAANGCGRPPTPPTAAGAGGCALEATGSAARAGHAW